MTTSGRMQGNSVNIGGYGSNYYYIDWQLDSQSIANNTSRINWQAKFRYNLSDAQLDNGSASLSGTRWSDSGRVRNYGADFRTRTVTLASGSFTIGHSSDGSRSLSVSGGVSVYGSGRSSGSKSFSLPTIPRNSQVTTNDSGHWSLGTPITIRTNRKSSSFTHTITIRLGGSGGTVLQTINSVGSSVEWTPTASQINTIQNSIPNDNRALIHITQRNNQVGQNSTTQAWTYVRDANPEFSNFTYKDSSAAVVAITGNDQVLVKGKSTLEVKVPAVDKMVAIKGSDPNYYAVAYDGVSNNVTYSTSAVTSSFTNIDTVGSRAILVTAYDSRKNNTRVAKNIQVYDYKEPNIELEITRENNFGNNVTVSTGGTFDLLTIDGVNKNSLTASSLKYRHREKGATTWGTWATIPFTVENDGFAGTDQFITLDNDKEWEFEFQIADKFGSVTQAAELGKGTPIQFVGRQSDGSPAVGIGKIPEDGTLDVAGDIYSNGERVVTRRAAVGVDYVAGAFTQNGDSVFRTISEVELPNPGTGDWSIIANCTYYIRKTTTGNTRIRSRIIISVDGGSTWNNGPEPYHTAQPSDLRTSAAVSYSIASVDVTGSIIVRFQSRQEGGTNNEVEWRENCLNVTAVPV